MFESRPPLLASCIRFRCSKQKAARGQPSSSRVGSASSSPDSSESRRVSSSLSRAGHVLLPTLRRHDTGRLREGHTGLAWACFVRSWWPRVSATRHTCATWKIFRRDWARHDCPRHQAVASAAPAGSRSTSRRWSRWWRAWRRWRRIRK